LKRPVGWVEQRPTKNRTQHRVFKGTEKPEVTKNRVNPTHYDTDTVWDVGFRYTYLSQRFIEERSTVYSENALMVLPLNPTYVHICILFFNPRLIIKLTLKKYPRK